MQQDDLYLSFLDRLAGVPQNEARIKQRLRVDDAGVAIYGLLDEQFEVRYVGKSIGSRLAGRLRLHLRTKPWVFGISILEWANELTWAEREEAWIRFYRMRGRGSGLMNVSKGGTGGYCYPHSDLTKLRMATTHLGAKHSSAAKAKIGVAHRGKRVSAQTRLKFRQNWESPELRARMLTPKGVRRRPETIQRIKEARRKREPYPDGVESMCFACQRSFRHKPSRTGHFCSPKCYHAIRK